MNIQWFPGHMAKTQKLIAENIKLVDIIVEVVDARTPASSQNPNSEKLFGNKKRLLALNKSDLADPLINKKWMEFYRLKGIAAVLIDSITGNGINELLKTAKNMVSEKEAAQKAKGRINRPVKLMVAGVPNVGKSTLINAIVKRKAANTADRPGVTKYKQWVSLGSDFMLLDMPGVLWPKFDDKETGYKLAFTGTIKDEVMDIQLLAVKLIEMLRKINRGSIEARFGISIDNSETDNEIFEKIAVKRGYILKGGKADPERCAKIMLDEYRGGLLGNISLEEPAVDGQG